MILGILILVFFTVVGVTLFYPQPTTTNSPSQILYNEAYFIKKFAEENIALLNQNTFVITEEELNGYANYQLQTNQVSFNQSGFETTGLKAKLLKDTILLDVYGKLYSLPVRLHVNLEPLYQDEKIYFTFKEAKFSRINIPEKYFAQLLGESIDMVSGIDKSSQFILPIELHEMVIIKNVAFENQQLRIDYELNKEKLIEELLKGLKNNN